MPRVVPLDDLGEATRDLVRGLSGDDAVLLQDGEHPVAILASHAAGADLPRWDQWVEEARRAFPAIAGRTRPAAERKRPEAVEKAALGFDPGAGKVGSPGGRDFLAGELRRLGVPVTDDALLDRIYAAVLELCEAKETVFGEDLKALAQELITEAPQRLRLRALTVQTTTGVPAMAEVTLELGSGPAMRREHGDGPLTAAFNAIEKLTGLQPDVENFSVVSVTRGQDAMAEAVIELALGGELVVGAGASTDAIEAGVHAYLNALNFLLETRAGE
jgi:2-isopropylmalate synthase